MYCIMQHSGEQFLKLRSDSPRQLDYLSKKSREINAGRFSTAGIVKAGLPVEQSPGPRGQR